VVSTYFVPVVTAEFNAWYVELPPADRKILYPLIGPDKPAGAFHVNWTWYATAVPLRAIVAVELAIAELVMLSKLEAEPTARGLNSTFSIALWPGFNVIGRVVPTIVKPVPDNVAAVIEMGKLPDAVAINDCVTGLLRAVVPKEMWVELKFSAEPLAISCNAKVEDELPTVAVSMTACAESTEVIIALKRTAVELGGTVTVAGSSTA
jgi:hypothetical protein